MIYERFRRQTFYISDIKAAAKSIILIVSVALMSRGVLWLTIAALKLI